MHQSYKKTPKYKQTNKQKKRSRRFEPQKLFYLFDWSPEKAKGLPAFLRMKPS